MASDVFSNPRVDRDQALLPSCLSALIHLTKLFSNNQNGVSLSALIPLFPQHTSYCCCWQWHMCSWLQVNTHSRLHFLPSLSFLTHIHYIKTNQVQHVPTAVQAFLDSFKISFKSTNGAFLYCVHRCVDVQMARKVERCLK